MLVMIKLKKWLIIEILFIFRNSKYFTKLYLIYYSNFNNIARLEILILKTSL